MSSLVELVFTAVGTEAVASSVDKVSGSLGSVTRELGAMAVGALSVQRAVDGVKSAIESGDVFTNLSLRVGGSVRELVVLDTAFHNASLGTETIAQSANLLQKALGGVNEMGGRTDVAFKRIGTSIEELKPLQFTQQLRVMSEGFAGLENQSDRTAVAMQIFGRSGGQMLQLLGDPEGLAQAEQQAGRLGDRMERDAKAFDAVGDRLHVINVRFREMWVVAAEQVLPTLNTIAHLFEGMNLSGIGAFLGAAGPGALGMVAMTTAFDFADRRLYGMLAKMEEGTARSMVRGVSNAMGMAALWTPVALAAGVTAQIVLGVIAAWQDSEVQKILTQMRNVRGEVQPFRDRADTETTAEGLRLNAAIAEAKLRELEQERARLAAKETLASNRQRLAMAFQQSPGIPLPPVGSMSEADEKRLAELRLAIPKLAAEIQNNLANESSQAAHLIENQLAATKASLEPLVAQLDQLKEKSDKLGIESASPAQKKAMLEGRKGVLESELAGSSGLGGDYELARQLSLKNDIAEIDKQLAEVNAKLAETAKQQADAAFKRSVYAKEVALEEAKAAGDEQGAARIKIEIEEMRAKHELDQADFELFNRMAAAKQKEWNQEQARTAERRRMDAEKNALDAALDRIRENIANIEGDFGKTSAEKWPLRRKQIDEEITRLETIVKLERERAANARKPGGLGEKVALEHDNAARDYERQLTGARSERAGQGANPNSLADQLTDKMNRAREAMGTWQETIASGFAEAFANASTGLQQLIGDTEYWTAKLGNIAGPIMGSITKAITDMFVTWIVQRGVAAVKNMMFSAEEGAADTAAKTPGAVLSSISSFGVAAAVGVAAIIAAMAAFGGFREAGGDVRAGVPYIVGERRPEVFVPPVDGMILPSVSAFAMTLPPARSVGAQNLAAMHSAALPPASRPAGGTGSSASGGRESAKNTHIYLDRSVWLAAVRADLRGIALEVYDEQARS